MTGRFENLAKQHQRRNRLETTLLALIWLPLIILLLIAIYLALSPFLLD